MGLLCYHLFLTNEQVPYVPGAQCLVCGSGHDDQWPRMIEIKVVVRLGIE